MYISQQVEAARRCVVQRGIENARRCYVPAPAPVQGGSMTHTGYLEERARCVSRQTIQTEIPSRIESRRILARINEANAVFDPASPTYRKPPVADPCPYPDTRYLRVGEPMPYEPFKCYDRVIGYN
jgi:hypothetical protein